MIKESQESKGKSEQWDLKEKAEHMEVLANQAQAAQKARMDLMARRDSQDRKAILVNKVLLVLMVQKDLKDLKESPVKKVLMASKVSQGRMVKLVPKVQVVQTVYLAIKAKRANQV